MAQQFSACLWPRARSWSPGIESHVGLPAWSLLLPPPVSLPLSLSIINKSILKKKGEYVKIHNKYPPFALTWMELEGIMLSEVSQSEKDKHYMFSFIWGI